ncbi:hypothetical protein [Prosthecobacter sp.]|jgi:hypothetical protein|uniref:hypothetical protein n=1 Tax=Prosthecobacter sp. TaxID=1965333 RepID=UPI0037C6D131
MSTDTLSQLITQTLAKNLRPLLWCGWATFAGVIAGTAAVGGVVEEVKHGIADAKREASEALRSTADVRTTVIGHDRDIAVLKAQRGAE